MAEQGNPAARKPSRQQLRAQMREKRDAQGWITALSVSDPWMRRSIRTALGNRHVTRTELEEALGLSLAAFSPDPAPTPASGAAPSAPASAPEADADPAAKTAIDSAAEPERIAVQHILISFAGAGTKATRSREEAEALANEVLARALQGEAFDDLVRTLTDDSFPGIYRLSNTGVESSGPGEYPRGRMVPAFGDVGFPLEVGGIGMASHDPRTSPYGWHIVKRLE